MTMRIALPDEPDPIVIHSGSDTQAPTAHLIDPHDPRTLSAAIHAVLTDTPLAHDLSQRGPARARLFTWERCARETLAVYQRVFES